MWKKKILILVIFWLSLMSGKELKPTNIEPGSERETNWIEEINVKRYQLVENTDKKVWQAKSLISHPFTKLSTVYYELVQLDVEDEQIWIATSSDFETWSLVHTCSSMDAYYAGNIITHDSVIYAAYCRITDPGNEIFLCYTVYDGSFHDYAAGPGDDAYDVPLLPGTAFKIGSDVFISGYDTQNNIFYIYNSDFSEKTSQAMNSDYDCSFGYFDSDNEILYFVGVKDGETSLKLMQFDGTNISEVETVQSSLVAGDACSIASTYSKRGQGEIIITNKHIYQKADGNWVKTVSVTGNGIRPIFDSNNEIEYVYMQNDTSYYLYYIAPNGFLMKIQEPSLSMNLNNGFDGQLSLDGSFDLDYNKIYDVAPVSEVPLNIAPIYMSHLGVETMIFDYYGTDWVSSLAIIATDDSDNIRFIGIPDPNKKIESIGSSGQRVEFVSPARYSLLRPITIDVTATSPEDILTAAIADDPFFKKITFDATGITKDYRVTGMLLQEVIREVELLGGKIFHYDPDGSCYLDDGDEDSGITIDHTSMLTEPDAAIRGSAATRIIVYGSMTTEGLIAQGSAIATQPEDQQINTITYIIKGLYTNADCENAAAALLTNMPADLQKIQISFTGGGKATPGTTGSIAYSPGGMAATDFIFDHGTLNLATEHHTDVVAYTGLLYSSNYFYKIGDSNQDRFNDIQKGFLAKQIASPQILYLPDNQASAFEIKESSNTYMKWVTTNSAEQIEIYKALDLQDQSLKAVGDLVFNDGGSTVNIIRDEDGLDSDDPNALATQQSIKAYVDDKILDLGYGLLIENDLYLKRGYDEDDLVDALDYLAGTDGTLHVPDGEITITSTITISTYVHVIGTIASKWDNGCGDNAMVSLGSYASIERIQIKGLEATNKIGIQIDGSYSSVKECFFYFDISDSASYSVGILSVGDYNTIQSNWFYGGGSGILIDSGSAYTSVIANWGVNCYHMVYSYGTYSSIVNNRNYSVASYAFQFLSGSTDNSIVGNTGYGGTNTVRFDAGANNNAAIGNTKDGVSDAGTSNLSGYNP